MSVPATAEEKINKKNDVKARSLLLMALPNEHQLTFSHYNDAKIMLAILGVVITQEDLNSKILRSLPPEWNTHVVVWMNKADVKTISIDKLYNNFKIVEQDVKKSVGTSTSAQNIAFMTAPSTSSTNDVNTANTAYKASTISPNVNTASPQVSTANFNDNVVYAFMVKNPNGSNLLQQDLEQIHEDDLEAMDLRYDKSKVECLNCHKMGHLSRECRAQRNQDGRFKNQDNTRKQGNNEDTSSKAILAIDGVGFDWSDMAEEQVQTNMALMAFSDSENQDNTRKQGNNEDTSSKAILAIDGVGFDWSDMAEEQNEVLFSEEVAVLKRDEACKDYEINVLKRSQINDNNKNGLGYHAVSPPHPLFYNGPTKIDLSYYGLDEFKEPEFKGYGPRDSKQESNINHDKKSDDSKENSNDFFIKEQVSKDTSSFVESPLNVDKETAFSFDKKIEFVKPKNYDKPIRKSVRYVEMYRSQRPRGNQRNWNGQKSNQLGSDFVMYNKACFSCGCFGHVEINCTHHQRKMRVSGNNYNRVDNNYYAKTTHPSAQRNMTSRAVSLKTCLRPFNTARPVYNAHPKPTVHSTRPITHFSKQA
nr:ribonuclease H-like domain-containing protein [Tanacetum cinerariifolium]